MRVSRLASPGFAYVGLMLVFLYLPILLLVVFSFNDANTLSLPLRGFTLRWYAALAQASTLLGSVGNSLIVGIGSSLVATILGALSAVGLMRFRFPGRNAFLGLAAIPLVIPSIVLGVALLVLFRQILDWQLTLWTVGLGHVVLNIPITLLIVASRLAGFEDNLEEAAMDLGASYWESLWRVVLPISLPALVAAFLTAFTTSFDEYAMSVFIIGHDPTLPVYLYSQLRFPTRLPLIVTLAAILMLGSVLILLVAEGLRRSGTSQSGKRDA
jgi:spermidine/putrescine transport system permease protein